MSVTHYRNESTGEITFNHNEAVEWTRHGVRVTLWVYRRETDAFELRAAWDAD